MTQGQRPSPQRFRSAQRRRPGIAGAVAVILRARWWAWRRPLRRRRVQLGTAATVLLLGGVGASGFVGARAVTRLVVDNADALLVGMAAQVDGPVPTAAQMLAAIPAAVFLVVGVTLLFMTFGSLLAALYLGGDMPRLLTAPIPVRAVFVAKLLESAAVPVALALALGLPVLAGYAAGRGFGPAAVAMAALLLVTVPLGLLGLSALLTLALVRVLPAQRVNELLKVTGTLLGVSVWLASQSLGMVDDDAASPLGILVASRWSHALVPARWLVRAVDAAGAGDWTAMGLWGAASITPALLLLGAGILVAERLYLSGWARGDARGRRTPRRTRRFAADPLRLLFSPAVAAIARKDWRVIRRDARGFARLVFPIVVAAFWAWQGLEARDEPEMAGAGPWFHAMAPAIALFALGGLAMQFSQEGLSRDRRSARLVLAAPVSPIEIALGKGLAAFAPTVVLGWLLVGLFGLAAGTPPFQVLANAGIVAFGLLGQTAIGLAVGAAAPRFDWTDPRKIVGTTRGCLGGLLLLAFNAVLFGVGLGPLVAASYLALPGWVPWLGVLLAAAVAAGATFAAGISAVRSFARVEL